MDIFFKQKAFLNEVESVLMSQIRQSIDAFDFVLKDYIVNKQLFREGIDGKGEKLAGYKRSTIRLKIRKGDPVDRTTLRDEGDFYASIFIDAFEDRFEISSDVDYDKYIIKRYGSDVLRVSNENFREFLFKYFMPNFKKTIDDRFTK